jgi:hypothetical protein
MKRTTRAQYFWQAHPEQQDDFTALVRNRQFSFPNDTAARALPPRFSLISAENGMIADLYRRMITSRR